MVGYADFTMLLDDPAQTPGLGFNAYADALAGIVAHSRAEFALATGLVAQAARRTVVGMLVGAGVAAVVSFHACCRFFSHHRWDVDRIGLVLARLIVDRLPDAGAPFVVVVDDTLFRR